MLIGAILVGSGAGLCLLGSAALVGDFSPTNRRAELYSAYLVIAFGALGLTALGSGPIIAASSVPVVLGLASAMCLLLLTYVALMSRKWLPGSPSLGVVPPTPL